jgi:hypothetical protein
VADVSDSFNFYDIYGYLLPGVALALLFLFPFWCYGHGPAADFGLGSALAATMAVYILGHLLQTIAVSALPSTMRDAHGVLRYPSEVVLNADDETFIPILKDEIAEQVRGVFGINVNDPAKLAPNRRDAFFLCRDALVASKQASYVEQFEGMYSLMRGLSAALLLGAGYLAGWSSALARSHYPLAAETTVLMAGLAIAFASAVAAHWKPRSDHVAATYILAGLVLALFALGHFLGGGMPTTWQHAVGFGAACAVTILLYFRCYGAYKVFAKEYAKAVWRGFVVLRKVSPPSAAAH